MNRHASRLLVSITLLIQAQIVVGQGLGFSFVRQFPDTVRTPQWAINNTIAVDRAGNVWMGSYSWGGGTYASIDSVWNGSGYTLCGAVRVFHPDGIECGFSPIRTIATGLTTDTLIGSGYGMTVDSDGNILLVKPANVIFRLSCQNGAGMNKILNPIAGYTNYLASPAVDSLGDIFVTSVLGRTPVAILNQDFTVSASNVADIVRDTGRVLAVSATGNDVWIPRFNYAWKHYTLHYHTGNGARGPYALQDTVFKGLVIESMAWQPGTGYLWVSSGNYNSGMPDPPYRGYTWYAFDTSTYTVHDSITWYSKTPFSVSNDPRPRGIAFSPTGDTAYVAVFGGSYSVGSPVQMFVRGNPSTNVSSGSSLVAVSIELDGCYPNPMNPTTTISYSLPSRLHVILAVFNTLGQRIATLVDAEREAGSYRVTFNANGLASGVYLYRMSVVPLARRDLVPTGDGQAGSFVQTRKMILLR